MASFLSTTVQANIFQLVTVFVFTVQVDIFQLDYYIVPVHRPAHWCLAVINMKNKRIDYYDSLGMLFKGRLLLLGRVRAEIIGQGQPLLNFCSLEVHIKGENAIIGVKSGGEALRFAPLHVSNLNVGNRLEEFIFTGVQPGGNTLIFGSDAGGKYREGCEQLRQYLELEHQDKKKTPYDASDWTIHMPGVCARVGRGGGRLG